MKITDSEVRVFTNFTNREFTNPGVNSDSV